ncbi:MAG: hypothetical protein ACREO8_10355 [Luteimonas sp.]
MSSTVVAALLVAVVLIASARMLWRLARLPANARPRPWRRAALLLLQAGSAALLYGLLFPPEIEGQAGTLVVLTGNAPRAEATRLAPGARRIALPEASSARDAERVPDLATALRRWPDTTRLRIVGAGLLARDRDAVRGRALDFLPAPLPPGVAELHVPARVPAGRAFAIDGRVHALPGGSLELLDPSDALVDHATLPRTQTLSGGRFRVTATARTPGLSTWQLRIRDAARREIERVDVALQVQAGATPRVLMLAGAPNAELKYLRRWATDTGMRLDTRISLGGGLQIGDAPTAFDAATLAAIDLAVLDQRAWQSLGDMRRAMLDQAVRGGLGLLLRLPEPLSLDDRTRLRRLGFTATASTQASEVRLAADRTSGSVAMPHDAARTGTLDARTSLPTLTRSAQRFDADDASVLLRDASDTPLALWRAQGRGRIGIVGIGDSYRLVLGGHGGDYGQLWSLLFETLARTGRVPDADIDADPRVGERVAICGLDSSTALIDSPATAATNARAAVPVNLHIDPMTATRRCAGFWPRNAGWHRLRDGDRTQRVYVRNTNDAPGLRTAATRNATLALVRSAASAAPAPVPMPGLRWPWLIGWLFVSALLWWLERSRIGLPARPETAGEAHASGG